MADFGELFLGARTEGLLKFKKALEKITRAGAATEKALSGTEQDLCARVAERGRHLPRWKV